MFNDSNMGVIEGGNLPINVERVDPTAISATIILKLQDGDTTITKVANYVDGVADLSLDGTDTATVGVYDYQINENYATGDPDKYPNPDKCEGEFKFPTITVYDSLDEV